MEANYNTVKKNAQSIDGVFTKEQLDMLIENTEFELQAAKELLEEINALGIGPQGFGGKTTALAVNIEKFPTHIAGLPVAVNINCHVTRHKSEVI